MPRAELLIIYKFVSSQDYVHTPRAAVVNQLLLRRELPKNLLISSITHFECLRLKLQNPNDFTANITIRIDYVLFLGL